MMMVSRQKRRMIEGEVDGDDDGKVQRHWRQKGYFIIQPREAITCIN
jgi:hypothetical protein